MSTHSETAVGCRQSSCDFLTCLHAQEGLEPEDWRRGKGTFVVSSREAKESPTGCSSETNFSPPARADPKEQERGESRRLERGSNDVVGWAGMDGTW
eukprot:764583-Hanusia_phi.AAC.1